MPPPIEPEKVDSTSVAPAMMNQVLTSWLLTTSPFSRASSRRFCVGSSVLSSVSSAISSPLVHWSELAHDAVEVVEIGAHHRREHHGEDQEADHDRERHADEIDLHLRHLSLIHISEPTRLLSISYAVF